MSAEDKAAKLLSQILRGTYAGVVSWRVSTPPASLTRATDNYVPIYMEARYKGWDIVVYEERYKHWLDEENFAWATAVKFGILTDDIVVNDFVKWSPLLTQLFDAAKESATGLDAMIESMLD